MRVAVAAALIFALTPSRAGAPAIADPRPPVTRPVLDDGPRIVRHDLVAAATGTERALVRTVRDLVENRFDVDALPPDAPITVWTVDQDIVAFDVTTPEGGTAFASRLAFEREGLEAAGVTERWVFDDGTSLDGPVLARPVRYHAVSSKIGRREHPVWKRTRFHAGTDYAAPIGTPVRSVADGVVVKASRSWTAGNFIVIRHDAPSGMGLETKYMHLHRRADGLVDGSRVRQGEIIGEVGKTGRVTGPHLHFEVRTAWRTPLDPVAATWPAAAQVADDGALRMLRLRRDLLLTFFDGGRDLLAPLVTPRLGVEEQLPPPEDNRALLPPIASVRTRSARAGVVPPARRRRRTVPVTVTKPLFDGASSPADEPDPLVRRAIELSLDFPDDFPRAPRFA